MKQLTEKQAIAFGESKEWQSWTHEQIVRLQLFQERLCIPFSRFHEAMNKVLDRPVFTHEFSTSNRDNLIKEYLGSKKPPTFEEIIGLIPIDSIVFTIQ